MVGLQHNEIEAENVECIMYSKVKPILLHYCIVLLQKEGNWGSLGFVSICISSCRECNYFVVINLGYQKSLWDV